MFFLPLLFLFFKNTLDTEVTERIKRKKVTQGERWLTTGASPPASGTMRRPDTFSNLPDDKEKKKMKLFVTAQTGHKEEWVCFALVSVDRGVSY